MINTGTLIEKTGLSPRQIDYWVRAGYIKPSIRFGVGSGNHHIWSRNDVAYLSRVKERIDWGMMPTVALRSKDPTLPKPFNRKGDHI